MTDKEKKEYVLGLVSDSVMDLMYYDRKECETFEIGDIEKLIESGVVTIDEMVDKFREVITY